MSGVENPKEAAGRAKLQLQLCPPAAKREMALALEHGAQKYGAWNWREAGINIQTYLGALQRHADAIAVGEDMDLDSGLSHWAHILACSAIVVDALEHDMVTDDRPAQQSALARAVAEQIKLFRAERLHGQANAPRYGLNGCLD